MNSSTGVAANFPSLTIRQREPENFESPFNQLEGLITPTELFYVRSHFTRPELDATSWRLNVQGRVERALQLSLDELQAMPAVRRVVTLECAGNGRVFLVPQVQGAQWGLGAVSTAMWTGVSLAAVLERAGIAPGAVDVVLQGADQGEAKEPPTPPGKIHYAHSLPIARAMAEGDDAVLLAYRMNDDALPARHGFPVRAIVPGWYGMASVKWLTHIRVLDRPFAGYFQTADYAYWDRLDGLPVRRPLTTMRPKAQIARPAMGEVIARDVNYRIHGAAWSGEAPVERVEVSLDAGETYRAATLLGAAIPYAWRLWEYAWRTPATRGTHTLMARATDARGASQPAQRDADWGTYAITHTVGVEVSIA